jgi:hypothetical protein
MPLFLMSTNNFLYMSTLVATDDNLLSPQESIFLDLDRNCNRELRTVSVPCNISVLSGITEVGGWVEEERVNY